MLISIIIPFYDKDHNHITNMLNYLSKLSFNKEVIFIDDRNDKSLDMRSTYNIPNEYKIINSSESGNIGTFESRRTGTMNATGDYIWFVDVDDMPLDFDASVVDGKKELYYFNAIHYDVTTNTRKTQLELNDICPNYISKYYHEFTEKEGNLITFHISNKSEKFVGYVFRYLFYSISFCVWDKLFKTNILREMYDSTEVLKNFSYGEDSFLVRLYLKHLVFKYKGFDLQISTSPNYIYYEYIFEKYNFKKRYEHFSKEKIMYTLEISKKFFKNTWLEIFTYLSEDDSEIERKQGSSTFNIKHNYAYSIIE